MNSRILLAGLIALALLSMGASAVFEAGDPAARFECDKDAVCNCLASGDTGSEECKVVMDALSSGDTAQIEKASKALKGADGSSSLKLATVCIECQSPVQLEEGIQTGGVFEAKEEFASGEGMYLRIDRSFGPNNVWCYIYGDMLDANADIRVVEDRNQWCDGSEIGGAKTATVSVKTLCGATEGLSVGNAPTEPNKYDLVVDLDLMSGMLGYYNCCVDPVDSFTSYGLSVLPEPATLALLGFGVISIVGYARMKRR